MPRAPRMTLKQALDIDINDFMELSGKELKAATKALADAANKRLTRLRKSEVPSPAARAVWTSGGKFMIGGKTEGELRTEFLRAKQFLEAPTSTVTAAKAARKRVISEVGQQGIRIDNDAYNRLLKAYMDNQDTNPDVIARTMKYMLMRETSLVTPPDMDIEDIAQRVFDEINNQFGEGGSQYEGTSRYFDLDEDL